MAKSKWFSQLSKVEGAVIEQTNPFLNVLKTVSPSANFVFGKGHGIPLGFTAVIYGPPKGGKSVLTNMFIGDLHQNDPEALAVKFDTEYRTKGQLIPEEAKVLYGIDMSRLLPIEENMPGLIFDTIEKKLMAMYQEGAPLKLVIIDSLYGIQGRRASEAESVEKQIIGDHASTIGDGLKRILRVQRKANFVLLLVDQVRSEMDVIEQKRGNKFKMRSAFAVQHHAEYFVQVENNRNKEGRADMAGNEFVDENLTDMAGKSEKTGLKIKVKMRENSMGVSGRTGEFTFDFHRGVINQHEEIFTLGKNRGIIKRPNNVMYEYAGESWRGESAALEGIKNRPDLQAQIVSELRRHDLAAELPTSQEGNDADDDFLDDDE